MNQGSLNTLYIYRTVRICRGSCGIVYWFGFVSNKARRASAIKVSKEKSVPSPSYNPIYNRYLSYLNLNLAARTRLQPHLVPERCRKHPQSHDGEVELVVCVRYHAVSVSDIKGGWNEGTSQLLLVTPSTPSCSHSPFGRWRFMINYMRQYISVKWQARRNREGPTLIPLSMTSRLLYPAFMRAIQAHAV